MQLNLLDYGTKDSEDKIEYLHKKNYKVDDFLINYASKSKELNFLEKKISLLENHIKRIEIELKQNEFNLNCDIKGIGFSERVQTSSSNVSIQEKELMKQIHMRETKIYNLKTEINLVEIRIQELNLDLSYIENILSLLDLDSNKIINYKYIKKMNYIDICLELGISKSYLYKKINKMKKTLKHLI